MTERIFITSGQAARLLRALEGAEGHLSDETVANAAANELDPAERTGIVAHLAGCAKCRGRVDRVRQTLEKFDTPEGRKKLDRMWDSFAVAATTADVADQAQASVLTFDQTRTQRRLIGVRQIPYMPRRAAQGRVAAAGKTVARGGTADVQLEWLFNEMDNGDLEGVFSSSSEEFAGAELTMNTEPVRRVVLTKVFGKSWMGRFVLPKEEWVSRTGRIVERVTFADGEIVTTDEEELR